MPSIKPTLPGGFSSQQTLILVSHKGTRKKTTTIHSAESELSTDPFLSLPHLTP